MTHASAARASIWDAECGSLRAKVPQKWNGAKISRQFGSGYPGDPKTKLWLRNHFDPVFGFPSAPDTPGTFRH